MNPDAITVAIVKMPTPGMTALYNLLTGMLRGCMSTDRSRIRNSERTEWRRRQRDADRLQVQREPLPRTPEALISRPFPAQMVSQNEGEHEGKKSGHLR